jgi:hypothetical protein
MTTSFMETGPEQTTETSCSLNIHQMMGSIQHTCGLMYCFPITLSVLIYAGRKM